MTPMDAETAAPARLGIPAIATYDNAVLQRLSWLGAHLVASATAAYGKIGLGFPEARIVFVLGRVGQLTGINISHALGVDRGGVSRALKSLTEAGLIQRAPPGAQTPVPVVPGIRLRQTRSNRGVCLTPAGLALLDKVVALTEGREHMALDGFDAEERAALIGYLDRLLINFTRIAEIGATDAGPEGEGAPSRKAG